MVRAMELALASYALNALWQAPLVYAAARLGAWMLRQQDVRWMHRLWVGALIWEVTLPAISADLWVALRRCWTWCVTGSGQGIGSVQTVQGGGTMTGGIAFPSVLLTAVTAMYLAMLAFFAGRFVWNLRRLARLRKASCLLPLSAQTSPVWEACLRTFALPPIALMQSPLARSPLTAGVFRRVVVLPPGFLEKLAEDDQRILFAHECAHVKRYDFALNLLYEVMALPVAFHPCCRWTRRSMVESREWVCDALAAKAGVGADRYARSLLRLAAQLLAAGPATSPHAIGMFDAHVLERRVMQLTKVNRSGNRVVHAAVLAGCAALALGTAASASAFRTSVLAAGSGQGEPSPAHGVRVSGGVMAGNIVSKVDPVYPADAKAAHVQGSVVLAAVIGRDGAVEKLQIVSGPDELGRAAIDAVRQWVYKPFLLNGQPTEVQTTITVNFHLAR